MDLIFTALDHGTGSVEASGGPTIPFALIEGPQGRKLARFAATALVEAQERAQENGLVFAQRYRPGGRFKRFSTIGNAAFLGNAQPLF